MKVYQIKTAHPATGRHKDFASLDCKRTDTKYFDAVTYGRRSVGWRTRELRVYNPAAPRPDIFTMALDYIIGPRAFDILGELLKATAELLPVTIDGEAGTHYFYNCTKVLDVLDPKSTIYEYCKPINHTTLAIPAFHGDKLRKCSFFRSRHSFHRIFYVDHEAERLINGAKAMIELHQITGWQFDLVWSDKEGPVRPRFHRSDNDPFEYRSVDGMRLVYEGSKWVVKPPSRSLVPEPKPEKKEEAPKEQPRVSHGKITPTKGKPATKPQKGIRVLQVQAVIPAKRGKPKQAPCLVCKLADQTFLARDRFRGHPFPEDWRTVELNFGEEKPWKADFYFYGPGALVCSKRVIDSCALAPLEDEGEFLPVRIKGMLGKFFLFNSTNCTNYFNQKKTIWKRAGGKTEPRQISKHEFWSQRIGGDCLFKLVEDGGRNLYCVERTGDIYDDEFKALVESEGFTGLAFKTVWSNKR